LPEYGGARDEFVKGRRFDFLLKGVLPLIVIAYIVSSVFKCGPMAAGAATPTKVAVAVTPVASVVPGTGLLGTGGMLGSTDYGFKSAYTPAAKPGTIVPATLENRVRCYAVRDARSVYSNTVVLQNGLFWVERYTRVMGGMIFNSKFGWYAVSDFGCAPGLDVLEVEFVGPTLTPTSRPVVKATSTSVPTVPLPTPTLRTGIVHFSSDGCRLSWLVWNVRSVYLIVGGKREPVAGDRGGQFVSYDLVPCVAGVARLEAVGSGGEKYIREIEIQGR
jgi:hypothetical protein